MTPDDHNEKDESDSLGLGGGTEYPIIGAGRSKKMEQRAVRSRWALSDETRRKMIEEQARIATDPDAKNREKTSAFRAVISADQMNQAEELHNPDHGNHPTAAEIAEELAQLQGRHEHGDTSPDA